MKSLKLFRFVLGLGAFAAVAGFCLLIIFILVEPRGHRFASPAEANLAASPLRSASPLVQAAPKAEASKTPLRQGDIDSPQIPAPKHAARRKMKVTRTSHELDGHTVVVASVVNIKDQALPEVVEMHDYNADGRVDGIIYANAVDLGKNQIWMAGWWRGPVTSRWHQDKGVSVKAPPNSSATQVGYYNLDGLLSPVQNLNFVVAEDQFLTEVFKAADDMLAGIHLLESDRASDSTPFIQKGIDSLILFLDKRTMFTRYGAKSKTPEEVEEPPLKTPQRIS